MPKLEMPMDGNDPNDKKAQYRTDSDSDQSGDNGEGQPSGKPGVAQQAGDVAKTGVKNAAKALKDNPTDLKAAGAKAVSSTVAETAKKAGMENSETVNEAVEKTSKVASTLIMIKGAAAFAVQAVGAAAAILVDPVTWIVIAVILAIIAIVIVVIASVQVFGKTDNADGCYGIGSSAFSGSSSGDSLSITATASKDSTENATTVADWLMTTNFKALGGKPMSREQAIGVIGNMWQESKVIPGIAQGGKFSADTPNSYILNNLSRSASDGKAVGLIQWDGVRRYHMVQYAESKGKHWSDLGIQLEWLKMEFDGETGDTYDRDQVLKQGFADTGKSVEFYVEAWEKGFTRAGQPAMSNRIKYANDFNASYKPGSGSAFSESESGGSCLGNSFGDSNVDTSSAVGLAVSISYPTTAESRTNGDQLGTSKLKPEYKEAKAKAEKVGGKDGYVGLYASCDRAVATVVKNTMDPKIPWGAVAAQRQYLKNSSKWKEYTSVSSAQPGDIWITTNDTHVMLYLGNVSGKEMIMHASYSQRGNSRVAALQERKSYVSDSLVDKGGRQYVGYHFVG